LSTYEDDRDLDRDRRTEQVVHPGHIDEQPQQTHLYPRGERADDDEPAHLDGERSANEVAEGRPDHHR